MPAMNRHLIAASFLAAAALAVPAAALAVPSGSTSSSNDAGRPQWGVGVAVLPPGLSSFSATEIYLPIQVAPALRVEPSLGILTADSGPVSESQLVLGVGVLLQRRVGTATDLYYGGRLKLGFASVSTDGPGGDDSGVDVVLAGAFGGEHWLGEHFSLGLEAQLGYYSLSAPSGDASGLFTAGLVLARVYF
jgi:hypothetical protein